MVKQISEVWNFFRKINKEIAQCNLCQKNLKLGGGTSNLRQHIANKHTINKKPKKEKKPKAIKPRFAVEIQKREKDDDDTTENQQTTDDGGNFVEILYEDPLTSGRQIKIQKRYTMEEDEKVDYEDLRTYEDDMEDFAPIKIRKSKKKFVKLTPQSAKIIAQAIPPTPLSASGIPTTATIMSPTAMPITAPARSFMPPSRMETNYEWLGKQVIFEINKMQDEALQEETSWAIQAILRENLKKDRLQRQAKLTQPTIVEIQPHEQQAEGGATVVAGSNDHAFLYQME